MKVIQIGFGVFGNGWYHKMRNEYKEIDFVGVDTNPVIKDRLEGNGDRFYFSFEEAMEKEKPDFVLNITPPGVHDKINRIAFSYGTPVLCEKPISDNFESGLLVVKEALDKKIPFMIAEPFRRSKHYKKLRKLLDSGCIGDVTEMFIEFRWKYTNPKEYLTKILSDPVLQDLAVHHFDTVRYLIGANASTVFASSYNPAGSWFVGNGSAVAFVEMENGVKVTLNGSLVSRGLRSDMWRIEGTAGAITMSGGDVINIENEEGQSTITDFSDVQEVDIVKDFLCYMNNEYEPETTAKDYTYSQAISYYAQLSSEQRALIKIPDPFR